MSKLKESFLLKIILPICESVVGTCAMKWYKQISLMDGWDVSRIEEWQNSHLRQFVEHAYHHTAYYKKLFDDLGIEPKDIQCREDLKKLPIITKQIVNEHYEELIPDNLSSFKYRISRSGGTTGIPMRYFCDERVWGYVTGAKIYYWKKRGYTYGDAFLALGSASLFSNKPSMKRRIYDFIRNEHPLNCVNMTEDICENYCHYLSRHHIHFVYGYAAAIYMFAQYVEKNKPAIPEIKAVFTTSENLTDLYRETIERAFGCKVMDCYGAKDAGITGYEESYHSYRIGYNTIVEVENEIAEGVGSVLSTNFLNYSFPLIRYSYGDEAELKAVGCDGYNGQVFGRILGRTSHVLRLENQHKLTATGMSMIMKEFDISAFDIQKTGVNTVLLRLQIIPEKYTDVQESRIRKTLMGYLGEDCTLVIEHVDHFKVNSNGKRTYFMV